MPSAKSATVPGRMPGEIILNVSAKGAVTVNGQTLTLDLQKGTVTIHETGEVLPCEQLGDQAMKILEAGGIKPMMRARFGKR